MEDDALITTIRYPILFKATPPRCGELKDVFCSFPHVHEVPEISSSEVRTVLDIGTIRPQTVVEHDGRLFRYLGHPGDEATVRAMSVAFMTEIRRFEPWRFTFEGGNRTEMPALSQALRNTLSHRLYLSGDGKQREEEAWPFLNDSRRYSLEARDTYRFEDFERKLTDVDIEEIEAARREHEREASKLLVIDGSYWIATPPPAISVDSVGYRSTARMVCENVFLPEWLDPKLGREYFPLSARAAALEYAATANPITSSGEPVEDYVAEVSLGGIDDPALWFDADAYSLCRTTAVLAGDAARQVTKNREAVEKIGGECVRSVLAARDEVMEMGTSIADWPDLSGFTFDVVAAWKASARKPGWADIPQNRRRFGDLICDRAEKMAAEMPISLVLQTRGGPTP